MYSGRTAVLNYGHYNEALAHPLGANFREVIGRLDYSYSRWQMMVQGNYSQYGLDQGLENNGKNIFVPYRTRNGEYGHKIGNGLKTDLGYLNARLAYLINPKTNLRLELGGILRQEKNQLEINNTSLITFGLRSTFRNIYQDL